MKTQVIVPAAGLGTRLKGSTPKGLVLLNHQPMILYSLRVFEKVPVIASVILVVPEIYLKDFNQAITKSKLTKVKKIVPGGRTRRESVGCGLKALDPDTELVV